MARAASSKLNKKSISNKLIMTKLNWFRKGLLFLNSPSNLMGLGRKARNWQLSRFNRYIQCVTFMMGNLLKFTFYEYNKF